MLSAADQEHIKELEKRIKETRDQRMAIERRMLAIDDIMNRTKLRQDAEMLLEDEKRLKQEVEELKNGSTSIVKKSSNDKPTEQKRVDMKLSITDRQSLTGILNNIRLFRDAPSDYLADAGIPNRMLNGISLNATSAGKAVLQLQAWGEIDLDDGQTDDALTMLVNFMLNHVNVQDKAFLRGLLGGDQKKN